MSEGANSTACAFFQASAAATLRAIAGCEWNHHSTHRDGVLSARFCSASLFIEEMNGSAPSILDNAYRSAWRSWNLESPFNAGISTNDSTVKVSTSSGRLAKSDNDSNMCQRLIA